MPPSLSRRAFLKAGAGAALSAVVGAPAKAAPPGADHLATLVDIGKCAGCEACVEACRQVNGANYPKPAKPFPRMIPAARVPVEDWSDRREVTDRLTPYNWLFIQHADVTINGTAATLNIPRRCMHCINPPCVKLCPFGAAQQLANRISRIDDQVCLGGAKCRSACPWQIPQRQTGAGLYLNLIPAMAGNGVMTKCDRCFQRVAAGQLPACVEACPEHVQTVGPRDKIMAEARKMVAETGGYLYGAEENGGTNTIYLSPVPFETLDRAIAQGPGKPHLAKVKNTMADANNLLAALVAAPLAGLAAALTRTLKKTTEPKDTGDADRT